MAITNRAYVDNLKVKISSIKTCEDLAKVKAEIMAYYAGMLASINAEIALLGALIVNPTDLGSVISWVSNFITSNVLGPYNKALLLEAQMIAEFAEIMALISSAVSTLTCNLVNFDDSGYKVPQFGAGSMASSTFGAG